MAFATDPEWDEEKKKDAGVWTSHIKADRTSIDEYLKTGFRLLINIKHRSSMKTAGDLADKEKAPKGYTPVNRDTYADEVYKGMKSYYKDVNPRSTDSDTTMEYDLGNFDTSSALKTEDAKDPEKCGSLVLHTNLKQMDPRTRSSPDLIGSKSIWSLNMLILSGEGERTSRASDSNFDFTSFFMFLNLDNKSWEDIEEMIKDFDSDSDPDMAKLTSNLKTSLNTKWKIHMLKERCRQGDTR